MDQQNLEPKNRSYPESIKKEVSSISTFEETNEIDFLYTKIMDQQNLEPKNRSYPESIKKEVSSISTFEEETNEIDFLYKKPEIIDKLEISINTKKLKRANVKAWGIPALIFFLGVLEVIYNILSNQYFIGNNLIKSLASYLAITYLDFIDDSLIYVIEFILICSIIILSVFICYYNKYEVPIKNDLNNLDREKQRYQEEIMRTRQGRWKFYYNEFFELSRDSGRVFFEDIDRYNQASKWRKEISSILEQGSEKSNLNEAQYLISGLRELIQRERNEQKSQKTWQFVTLITILFYIIFLSGLMIYIGAFNQELKAATIPLINIPLWVVIWGALGSLSAILYRFYNAKKRIKFSQEFRWLIARPTIGILMSAVAYLTIQSGLILLGASNNSNTTSGNAERISAIFCFLAGFSDRVYLRTIDILVEKIGLPNNNKDRSELDSINESES